MPQISSPFPATCPVCQSNPVKLVEEYETSTYPLRFEIGEMHFECDFCERTWDSTEELASAFDLAVLRMRNLPHNLDDSF